MEIKILYGTYGFHKTRNGVSFFFRRKKKGAPHPRIISLSVIPDKFQERIKDSFIKRNMDKKWFPNKPQFPKDKLKETKEIELSKVQFVYGSGVERLLRIHALVICHSKDHFSYSDGRGKVFYKLGKRDKDDPTVLFEKTDDLGLSCGFYVKKPKKKRKKKKKSETLKPGEKVALSKEEGKDLIDEIIGSLSESEEENDPKSESKVE